VVGKVGEPASRIECARRFGGCAPGAGVGGRSRSGRWAAPRAGSLVVLVAACAVAGAAASGVSLGGFRRQLGVLSVLLGGGQLVGHLALGAGASAAAASVPCQHHQVADHGSMFSSMFSPGMQMAHVVAVVGVAVLLVAAERLCLAGTSVFRRLRAFRVVGCRPMGAGARRLGQRALVRGLPLGSGQGTRAPPPRLVCA
jgi:hypothetical protein